MDGSLFLYLRKILKKLSPMDTMPTDISAIKTNAEQIGGGLSSLNSSVDGLETNISSILENVSNTRTFFSVKPNRFELYSVDSSCTDLLVHQGAGYLYGVWVTTKSAYNLKVKADNYTLSTNRTKAPSSNVSELGCYYDIIDYSRNKNGVFEVSPKSFGLGRVYAFTAVDNQTNGNFAIGGRNNDNDNLYLWKAPYPYTDSLKVSFSYSGNMPYVFILYGMLD